MDGGDMPKVTWSHLSVYCGDFLKYVHIYIPIYQTTPYIYEEGHYQVKFHLFPILGRSQFCIMNPFISILYVFLCSFMHIHEFLYPCTCVHAYRGQRSTLSIYLLVCFFLFVYMCMLQVCLQKSEEAVRFPKS